MNASTLIFILIVVGLFVISHITDAIQAAKRKAEREKHRERLRKSTRRVQAAPDTASTETRSIPGTQDRSIFESVREMAGGLMERMTPSDEFEGPRGWDAQEKVPEPREAPYWAREEAEPGERERTGASALKGILEARDKHLEDAGAEVGARRHEAYSSEAVQAIMKAREHHQSRSSSELEDYGEAIHRSELSTIAPTPEEQAARKDRRRRARAIGIPGVGKVDPKTLIISKEILDPHWKRLN